MEIKELYTLQDYQEAKTEFEHWNELWANCSENNPKKYQSNRLMARDKLRLIESYLKNHDKLPLTEREQFERELDNTFPNAQSRQIVEYKGKRYQRRFYKRKFGWYKSWVEMARLKQYKPKNK